MSIILLQGYCIYIKVGVQTMGIQFIYFKDEILVFRLFDKKNKNKLNISPYHSIKMKCSEVI
jgi:hypothetical protein